MPPGDILNLAQAHEFLGVSEKTLRNYCKAGKVPFHHEKNLRGVLEYRFRLADLQSFAQTRARRVPGSPLLSAASLATPPDGGNTSEKSFQADASVTTSSDDPLPGSARETTSPPPLSSDPVKVRPASSWPEPGLWAQQLVEQLQAEVTFLKEQLQEKERQLTVKDRQLERQLERMAALNETLAALVRERSQ